MDLEGVDIFEAEKIRTAAKIPAELRYRAEVRLLRRRRQIADRHVLDHAAAKRADHGPRAFVNLAGIGGAADDHGERFVSSWQVQTLKLQRKDSRYRSGRSPD